MQAQLFSALQALQGQTITPELLQSLMSSATPPPPPPPPPQRADDSGDAHVDDLVVAQQVAEQEKRILAAMAAPRIGNFKPAVLDPFADQEFSDSDEDEELIPAISAQPEEKSASLDALLNKHNLTTVADDEISDQSDAEDMLDPEIFAAVPDFLPSGEPEISAGRVESVIESGKLLVVSACPPLDAGTSLALKNSNRAVIAVVVDTFGSVTAPLLLAVAREPLTEAVLGQELVTVASLAKQILLDEANGVFAIRGERNDVHALEYSDIENDDEDDECPPVRALPPPPPPQPQVQPQPPRAPTGFSWK